MEKDALYGSICKEGSRPLYLADKIDDGNQSSYLNSPDGQKIKNDEHIITNGPKNLLVTWEKRRNMIHNKCKVVSNGLWRIL